MRIQFDLGHRRRDGHINESDKVVLVVRVPRESGDVVHDHELHIALVLAAELKEALEVWTVCRLRRLPTVGEHAHDLRTPRARSTRGTRGFVWADSDSWSAPSWTPSCK